MRVGPFFLPKLSTEHPYHVDVQHALAPHEVPTVDACELLEDVAKALKMGTGTWRLEIRYENGHLLRIDRHDERLSRSAVQALASRRTSPAGD